SGVIPLRLPERQAAASQTAGWRDVCSLKGAAMSRLCAASVAPPTCRDVAVAVPAPIGVASAKDGHLYCLGHDAATGACGQGGGEGGGLDGAAGGMVPWRRAAGGGAPPCRRCPPRRAGGGVRHLSGSHPARCCTRLPPPPPPVGPRVIASPEPCSVCHLLPAY